MIYYQSYQPEIFAVFISYTASILKERCTKIYTLIHFLHVMVYRISFYITNQHQVRAVLEMYLTPYSSVQSWSKETQLWIKNFWCTPPEGGGSTFINSQPPSKLIYLFQGADKKFMDQSCVSLDQHCNDCNISCNITVGKQNSRCPQGNECHILVFLAS